MISHIRGKLVEKTPTHVVVESNGVGFKMLIPISSYQVLGEIGNETTLLCHLHAREDGIRLFGFATEQERELFLLLITVSGVGPRLAQSILSGISVQEFKQALRNGDIVALTSAPGVGKKTAERLLLELREKIGISEGDQPRITPSMKRTVGEEALLALESLGYKRIRAQEIVQKVLQESPSLTVEELIRQALRRI